MSVPFSLDVLPLFQTSGVPLHYRCPMDLVSRFCDAPRNAGLAKDLREKVREMGFSAMGVAGSHPWERDALLKLFDRHGDFDEVSGQKVIIAAPFLSLFEDPHMVFIIVLQKNIERQYVPTKFREFMHTQGYTPIGFADFVSFIENAEKHPEVVTQLAGKIVFLDFEIDKKRKFDWPPEWDFIGVPKRMGCVMKFGVKGEFELCFLAHDEHTPISFRDVAGQSRKSEENVYFLTTK